MTSLSMIQNDRFEGSKLLLKCHKLQFTFEYVEKHKNSLDRQRNHINFSTCCLLASCIASNFFLSASSFCENVYYIYIHLHFIYITNLE